MDHTFHHTIAHRLLEDNHDVVRSGHSLRDFGGMVVNPPNGGYVIPFPLIDR